MTDQEIENLGPEFSTYLGGFRCCFPQERTAGYFDTFCRALMSELPRKSVEPIALKSGIATRTLQEFFTTTNWDHELARNLHQQGVCRLLRELPSNNLGRIGVIDETSVVKKGDQTPGVQRQYCGAVGKQENCIVTVHIAVVQGAYKTLLDADLYLPESWSVDRERCREAKIPDTIIYRAKWRIAEEQVARASRNGLKFDWLTFDEGYGGKVPFLRVLCLTKQRFVGEVPKSFWVRTSQGGKARRADEVMSAKDSKTWRRFWLSRKTLNPQVWRAKEKKVWVDGYRCRLIMAINETTGEEKYFLTNAVQVGLARVMRVAFCRWNVEHMFRVAKQEAGLMHYEGRNYQGLMRHLIMGLIVMGFVSQQTEELRKKKSADYSRASMPSPECPMRRNFAMPTPNFGDKACRPCNPLPSAA